MNRINDEIESAEAVIQQVIILLKKMLPRHIELHIVVVFVRCKFLWGCQSLKNTHMNIIISPQVPRNVESQIISPCHSSPAAELEKYYFMGFHSLLYRSTDSRRAIISEE